jgi:hypothetical protein
MDNYYLVRFYDSVTEPKKFITTNYKDMIELLKFIMSHMTIEVSFNLEFYEGDYFDWEVPGWDYAEMIKCVRITLTSTTNSLVDDYLRSLDSDIFSEYNLVVSMIDNCGSKVLPLGSSVVEYSDIPVHENMVSLVDIVRYFHYYEGNCMFANVGATLDPDEITHLVNKIVEESKNRKMYITTNDYFVYKELVNHGLKQAKTKGDNSSLIGVIQVNNGVCYSGDILLTRHHSSLEDKRVRLWKQEVDIEIGE